MQLVDEVQLEQRLDELAAAADEDVALVAALDPSSSSTGGTIQPSRSAGASVLLTVPMNATQSGASPCNDATGSRS